GEPHRLKVYRDAIKKDPKAFVIQRTALERDLLAKAERNDEGGVGAVKPEEEKPEEVELLIKRLLRGANECSKCKTDLSAADDYVTATSKTGDVLYCPRCATVTTAAGI